MVINTVVIFLIIGIGFFIKLNAGNNFDSYQNRKHYVLLVSLILILQSGLRNVAVGVDTYAYFLWFEDVKFENWNYILSKFILYFTQGYGKDPGYDVLQKFIQIFVNDYQLYILIIAFIWFLSLGLFLLKNTESLNQLIFAYIIYIIMFYSFYSITGIRQTIAMALCIFSFPLIQNKKLLPFILIVFVASTIHKSSLVFLATYFLYHFKFSKMIFIITIVSFPIIFLLKNSLFDLLASGSGYELYSEYEGAGTYTFTALLLLLSIILFIRYNKISIISPKINGFINIFVFSILSAPLTFVNPSAMRIVMYFSFFMIILIPILIESYKAEGYKFYKIIKLGIFIVLFILFVKQNVNTDYKFFWQEMKLNENY